MNRIFLLITTTLLVLSNCNSQNPKTPYDYASSWESVSVLEETQKTKEAQSLVLKIEKAAKEEKNASQEVKSLIYLSKYSQILEEDSELKTANKFKEAIAKSNGDTKAILQSYLAQLYWNYFLQHSWQFRNRSNAQTAMDENDFRTYDYARLKNEVVKLFKASLGDEKLLNSKEITLYSDILNVEEGENGYELRPTLFDLLAHEAINFYISEKNYSQDATDAYVMTDAKLLLEANNFVKLKLEVPSSYSSTLEALALYQKLCLKHFTYSTPQAFYDIDILRLRFIYEHLRYSEKENLYIETLKKSFASREDSKDALVYQLELARLYLNQGNTYSKENPQHQFKKKEALDLCELVKNKSQNLIVKNQASTLIQEILSKNLNITAEQYIATNTFSKAKITYTNYQSIDLEIFQITQQQLENYRSKSSDEQKVFIQKLENPVYSKKESLKTEGDFQSHSQEVLIPKLKHGIYLLTLNDTFNLTNQVLHVTDLSLVSRHDEKGEKFFILNRIDGKPIKKAKVHFHGIYGYGNDEQKIDKYFETDNSGSFIYKNENYLNQSYFEVEVGDYKTIFQQEYFPKFHEQKDSKYEDKQTFLFTDRSIYRPGQTVYFKGILVEKKDIKSEVIAKQKGQVILKNVNYEEVSKLDVHSNDFGSFTGSFVLPMNGLTGSYTLSFDAQGYDMDANLSFSVEEYKRPKFEVDFDAVEKTFEVNDQIQVNGRAIAFAGSNISEAKVRYTVKRKPQYPAWCWWRWYDTGSEQEIAFGETVTDENGVFTIDFQAIPDLSLDKKDFPIFNYEISVDVTDINGETRSATSTVKVAYHTIEAQINVKPSYDKASEKLDLSISTTNLNGQFADVKGTLKIYELNSPEYVIRKRPWEAPDYKNWTAKEFKALFPHEAYDQEGDYRTWPLDEIALEKSFESTKESKMTTSLEVWQTGKYKAIFEYIDTRGEKMESFTFFTVNDSKSNKMSGNDLFSFSTDKSSYEVGEIAKITLNSAYKNLCVRVTIEKNHKIVSEEIHDIGTKAKTIEIPVTEKDLGGFAVSYSYLFQNSFESGTETIAVPYPSKNLIIETETFRDKLEPGVPETWRFKIKNPDSSDASAELLASMYDMSLNEFRGHSFIFSPLYIPKYFSKFNFSEHANFGATEDSYYFGLDYFESYTIYPLYPELNWFGFNLDVKFPVVWDLNPTYEWESSNADLKTESKQERTFKNKPTSIIPGMHSTVTGLAYNEDDVVGTYSFTTNLSTKEEIESIPVRKNLQETAFFFPQLRTDEKGEVSFEFTTPEALTKWKLQLLAHTKDLNYSYQELTTVTQKELMVAPNFPRFMREGDVITVQAKVSNLTDKVLQGQAQLVLTDIVSGKKISSDLIQGADKQEISIKEKGNTSVSWTLKIPQGLQGIEYKVLAKAGDFTDGEQNTLPVLSNRMLITETLPIWIKSGETKTFTLDKLKNNSSTTLSNHQLTLEMTSNPAWYAVQALPYLMEYPYECAEQTFARFYANRLAQHIVQSKPQIKKVFDQWASSDALISNLEKNQELKMLLIEETPWLRDAQSESEQQKRIALLFDLNQMSYSLDNALNKLTQMQNGDGSWSWFKGGEPNRYITQHIISGFGHLKQLNVPLSEKQIELVSGSMNYLHQEFVKEYEDLKKYKTDLSKNNLSAMQLHYLYLMCNFPEYLKKDDKVAEYYLGQIEKYWTSLGLYQKAMAAIVMQKNSKTKTASDILYALKQNAIISDELGMYWKENTNSYYWYKSSIETQAMLIEAFSSVENDTKTVDLLKQWLLKNKQTNRWETTKATSEAVFALLLKGGDWLTAENTTQVTLGKTPITPSKTEAGTGYYKMSWKGAEVKPEMATVKVAQQGEGIAWGALYWQYFEDLDKISKAKTPLALEKKLYKKINTKSGEQLIPITDTTELKVGDLVRVVTLLKTDSDMEFVHLKDMRASCFEPVDVISSYKWQGGIGYYQSTKDASTNFFIDYLRKGQYVFEYDLRVNNAGSFSNGISSIQCMYAPEFTSHSEGIRVLIKN